MLFESKAVVQIEDAEYRKKDYIYDCGSPTVPRDATHVMVHPCRRTIAWRAFDGCTSLTQVNFDGLNLQIIHSLAFWGCTSLRHIYIPSSVERIDAGAFERCLSLQEIEIPSPVAQIADGTFYGCTAMEQAIMNHCGLEKIGKYAFADCQSLIDIQLCNRGLRVIGSCAFMGCTSLVTMTIPSSVISIGHSAFENCISLREVIMEAATRSYTHTAIHKRAFAECSGLESLKLYNSIRVLHKSAFDGCTNLHQLDLPWRQDLKTFRATWPLIQTILQRVVTERRYYYDGCDEQWRSNLRNEFESSICARSTGSTRKQRVHELSRQLNYYRRADILSTVELALWKKKMEEIIQEESSDEGITAEDHCNILDRNGCRVTCGTNVVLQSVVGFLWDPTKSNKTCSIRPFNSPEFDDSHEKDAVYQVLQGFEY
mmetsp:Transcript_45804/g.111019  ORF Transcript_45804/g.111019 Transcript_45804/m.111019 type:complete len:428 (+) Transcript_45804:170-1453(+)